MVRPEFSDNSFLKAVQPPTNQKIPLEFYRDNNIICLAKFLIGKIIYTNIDGWISGGMITETEAYKGPEDRASHAYRNRRTKRTEVMFYSGGLAYVYLCYGIHHMFNIVTGGKNYPHAILVRGIYPVFGVDIIKKRRRWQNKSLKGICSGPGNVGQGLNIRVFHSGISLSGDTIWIEDHDINFRNSDIVAGPRIGIDYAGKDAKLPWRFLINIS